MLITRRDPCTGVVNSMDLPVTNDQMDEKEMYDRLREDNDGKLPSWAWPGGYPMYYLCRDGEVLCPKCANDPRVEEEMIDQADPCWILVGYGINYEDDSMFCANCNDRIEPAYGED